MKYLRYLLFPFAVVYNIVTSVRNFLYDTHLFRTTSFQIPILIVGNLSVGGTGKTPQVEYLVRLLKNTYRVAILSRGYKRKTKGFLLLDHKSTFLDSGDEPMQYFKKFSDVVVAVDENRVSGVQSILEKTNPEVIILDDAFQHRKIRGSFYILLTAYNDLFTKDFLLPAGNLRESRASALRADMIVVTKCPPDLSEFEQHHIRESLQQYQDLIYFTSISYESTTQGSRRIKIKDLKKYKVLLVTGIAKPNHLLDFLKKNEVSYTHLKFSDHHHFSENDIAKIKKEKERLGSEALLLTTEKDYIRLQQLEDVSYIAMKIEFMNQVGHRQFDDIIVSHIQKFTY